MKVILAEPPSRKEKFDIKMPNTDILYFISYLREKIDNLDIYYLDGCVDLTSHLSKLKKIRPDIYVISVTTEFAEVVYKIINTIKYDFPSLIIICSGPHPTIDIYDIFINSKTDVCILGEGEETLTELVEYFLRGNKRLSQIKGIAYKESGQIIRNPARPLIKDLDSIPFPAWDKVNFRKHPGPTRSKVESFKVARILVSRGCPYNCNFCSNPVWKINKPWLRLRSPKNISKEVEYLYTEYGIREIILGADEFNSIPKWSLKVCEEIKELGHDDLFFQTNLRANNFPVELAKGLSDINCWSVGLGVESGNQRTLNGINKRISLDQIVNTCKKLKIYDIKIIGFFSIFHIWEENGNLCYESSSEVMKTLNFARTLLSEKLIDYLSWGFVVPVPGTTLYDICLQHNLIGKENKIKLNKWVEVPVNLPGIDEDVMQRLKRKGLQLQLYYNGIRAIKNINWKNWRHFIYRIEYIIS